MNALAARDRDANEQLRARLALEATGGHVYEFDLRSGRVERGPGLASALGFTLDELPSDPAWWRERTAPDDLQRIDRELEAIVARRASIADVEYRIRHRDGRYRWINERSRLEYDAAGRLVRMVGCTFDIDARKSAELALARRAARQSLLLELTRELTVFLDDERAVLLRSIFERVHEALGADVAFGHCWNAARRKLELVAAHGIDFAPTRLDADPRGVLLASLDVKAYVCHPLQSRDGKRLGHLSFGSRTKDAFDAEDMEFLQTLSYTIALTWERLDASRQQRESEARARFLLELETALRTLDDPLAVQAEAARRLGEHLDAFGAGRTVVRADIPGDTELSDEEKRAHATLGLGSIVKVPILRRDRLVGVFTVHQNRARTWSEDEVALIEAVAERTWEAIERAKLLAHLHAADRQKDEFLAMLAHELRNPLAPIRNATALLKQAAGTEGGATVATPLAMLERQTQQLARLVDDLLDVSRIAQGRIVLHREPLEIGAIVEHAVETMQPLIREKAHRLRIIKSQPRLYVDGDRARLVQCVANVLHNAAKYTDPGGELTVEVRTSTEEEVTIEVRDTGQGIPRELLPRVFDLFVQGERTLDRAQDGLGIGLSVVKRLVGMHGGEVTAQSDGIGGGSTFRIDLPQIAPPPPTNAQEPPLVVTPRRVLVVDDNRDAADSLALLLRIDGHHVETAYGAQDALAAVDSFGPDLVLLDIGLPQMDGYEVARRIRSNPARADLRLVALTGYGQREDRDRAHAAGFDEHLVKPADASALARVLAIATSHFTCS